MPGTTLSPRTLLALPHPAQSGLCTKDKGPVLPYPAPRGCGMHSGHPSTLQVAIKVISTAEVPVELSCKFLPREISSLNATYKHLNVVGRAPTTASKHPAHPRCQPSPHQLPTPGPPPPPP